MDLAGNATYIAGVDEAGRGPLAGPVIAAAVILNKNHAIENLADSKKLSATVREKVYDHIITYAVAYAVGRAEVIEIDQFNIHHASLLAMQRAVNGLAVEPDHVLVDGKFCPSLFCPVSAIIQGDQKVPAISAASILAKVVRDREMIEYEKTYPGYGFAQHKGYPTSQHLKALQQLGASPIHRCSYAPVREVIAE